jgi:hypothetical protein
LAAGVVSIAGFFTTGFFTTALLAGAFAGAFGVFFFAFSVAMILVFSEASEANEAIS